MKAKYFCQLFDYHFALNHKVWDQSICTLTGEQFVQDLPYSIGSIRNQTVHMMSVDERWFSGLRGVARPDFLDPAAFPDRPAVRAYWDTVEMQMRDVLKGLTDEQIEAPFAPELATWQMLLHLVNHGTDHRAQMLAMLNSLGAPTFSQDYLHYLFGRI